MFNNINETQHFLEHKSRMKVQQNKLDLIEKRNMAEPDTSRMVREQTFWERFNELLGRN